jgi:hypothetical protein
MACLFLGHLSLVASDSHLQEPGRPLTVGKEGQPYVMSGDRAGGQERPQQQKATGHGGEGWALRGESRQGKRPEVLEDTLNLQQTGG